MRMQAGSVAKYSEYSDTLNHPRPWHTVKSVIYDTENKICEERTVLFRAESHEEALAMAEKDTTEYCAAIPDCVPTPYSETYHIFEEDLESGVEVSSIMRKSNLDQKEYLRQFVTTGEEAGVSSSKD